MTSNCVESLCCQRTWARSRLLLLLAASLFFGNAVRVPAQTVVRQQNFYQGIGLYARMGTTPYLTPSNCAFGPYEVAGSNASQIVANDVCRMYAGYDSKGIIPLNEPAIRLTTGGPGLQFAFTNLLPGVYFVRTLSRVGNPVEGTVAGPCRPLYLHWRINDGLNGLTNDYRVRCLYSTNLEEVGRIFFNGLYPTNNLVGELFSGPGSQNQLLVHRVEFYDALAGTDRRSTKTSSTSFTAAERAYARQVVTNLAALGVRDPDPVYQIAGDNPYWRWVNLNSPYIPLNLAGQDRINRDDILWNAFPPVNVMHTGSGLDPAYVAPAGNNGQWALFPSGSAQYYPNPLLFTNATSGAVYSLADYVAHRTLPGPFPDDGLGWWTPGGNGQYTSPKQYFLLIGPLMYQRMYQQYYEALSSEHASPGVNSALRYHLTANTNAAYEGALMLARFALQWPAMQLEAQDLTINTDNPLWRWEGRRVGKLVYDGWSDYLQSNLYIAYDRLFDYINGNAFLANSLHRYIPWINTPADVLTFFDTYLVQAGIQDDKVARTRTSTPMLLGLIQGPSASATALMDISKSQLDVFPLGMKTMKSHYHNSFSQDGTVFIGSLFYLSGESAVFLDGADSQQRYKNSGGTLVYDLTAFTKFPKISAFSDFFLSQTVAGGFEPSFGDASFTVYAPRAYYNSMSGFPFCKEIWRFSKDPRAAWIIQNVLGGRTSESDTEWAAITSAAATVRDPRMSSRSRVFAGLGLGILESGVDADDFRAKRAAVLRCGTGRGHSHNDALDLSVFADGFRAANDFAQRNENDLYTVPPDSASYTHNVVEVDGYYHHTNPGGGWPGGSFTLADSWIEAFKTNSGVQFMAGFGQSLNHNTVDIFRRDVALVDVDGTNSYVFDVFRVRGGKWHTWCFHGADCGVEPGGFTVNTALNVPVAGSLSDYYLRKHDAASRREGLSRSKVEALWRLSRTSSTNVCSNADAATLTVTSVAAEQSIYGNDFDANSPRKFTKVAVFDHPDDVVMAGNLYSGSYQINMPILYLQSRQSGTNYATMTDKEVVYPAVIEPFVGQPFISNSVSLPIANNENDALRAVALQVQTANGNSDLLFSDGRRALRVLTNGLMSVQGRFAYFSQTPSGFRMLNLLGGSQLARGDMLIVTDTNMFSTTVQSVDYAGMKIYTSSPLPNNLLAGQQAHLYNANHHCSYKIIAAASSGAGTVVSFGNPADVGEFAVSGVASNSISSYDALALDFYANRSQGFTALNELGTKVWKTQKSSLVDPSGSFIYQLAGPPISDSDFTDQDGDGLRSLELYDFGAGDSLEVPSSVWLQKTDTGYLLNSDVGLTLTLPGSGKMEIRLPSGLWQNVTVGSGVGSVTGRIGTSLLTGRAQEIRIASGTTDTNAPVISGVQVVAVTDAAATIVWATDEPANSQVDYGTISTYGQSTLPDPLLVTTHNVTLSGLWPATQYHFRIKSSDIMGNLSVSSDLTFTALALPNKPPSVYAGADQTVTNAFAVLSGTVADDGLPNPPGAVTTSWWQVSGPAAVVFGNAAALTTMARFSLEGSYRFRLTANDGQYSVSDEVAVTVIGPLIFSVNVGPVTGSNAVVTWSTSVPSDSQVEFGVTPAYGQSSPLAPALISNHQVLLTSLAAGTTYHVRVKSRDGAGNLAVSADSAFVTLSVKVPAKVYIPVAAESGILTAPMALYTDPKNNQLRYVMSSRNNRGAAEFNFYIPQLDNYTIWCRVRTIAANQDTFSISSDGGTAFSYNAAAGTYTNGWQWSPINQGAAPFSPTAFSYSAGNHSLAFRAQEANTALNRFILSNDPEFRPIDNQPVAGIGTALTLTNMVLKLVVSQGLNLLANQLYLGGNTVAEIMPTVAEGTQLLKFNPINRAYTTNVFHFGQWTNPTDTLNPGDGAFINNSSGAPLSLSFTGRLQLNNLPRSLTSGMNLISGLYPRTGTISGVLDFPPAEGDTVYQYDNLQGLYTIYGYYGGSWEMLPPISIGEAFFMLLAPRN